MNFVSYAESLEQNSNLVDIIENTLMSSLLNKDGVIQIGNYIYKINPTTEKVYSMPSDKIAFYNDLVNEDISKNYISRYDIWVDAIDAAESKGLCFESYAKSRNEIVNAYRTVGYAQDLIIRGKTRYQAFGVFFSLNAFVSSWVQGLSWNNLESDFPEYYTGGSGLKLRIDGSRIYKERCKNETGWMDWSVNGFSQSQNQTVKLNSYQGSKGLNKYWLKTNFVYWNNLKQAWEDIGFLGNITPQGVIYYPYRSGVKYGY